MTEKQRHPRAANAKRRRHLRDTPASALPTLARPRQDLPSEHTTGQPGLQQRGPYGADRQRGSQGCSKAGQAATTDNEAAEAAAMRAKRPRQTNEAVNAAAMRAKSAEMQFES